LYACALFFIPEPPPPEIYTLSLHDALPICETVRRCRRCPAAGRGDQGAGADAVRLAHHQARSLPCIGCTAVRGSQGPRQAPRPAQEAASVLGRAASARED